MRQPIGICGPTLIGPTLGALDMHKPSVEQHADRGLDPVALDTGVSLDCCKA